MENPKKTREIQLADGNVLTIFYNETFYDKVRQYFKLASDVIPNDEHLKEFFVTFMANAR